MNIHKSIRWAMWFVLCIYLLNGSVSAQDNESDELSSDRAFGKLPNLPLPTLGGRQFWTDHRWWYGYRLQYNNSLNHWRLLNPHNVRLAWGGHDAMLKKWDQIVAEQPKRDPPKRLVVLLHGLMRTSASMTSMANAIEEDWEQRKSSEQQESGMVISFTYASGRDSIANHSSALREWVEHLPRESQLSFVGHSMGNIVLRHAIGEWQRSGDPERIQQRFAKVVMLGPPNNGSSLADKFSKLRIFEVVTGAAGAELGPAWEKMQDSLGTPSCPFLIIVGDVSQSRIQNPWLDGPSDFVVTRDEAMLEGAQEVKSFPVLHSFLMSDLKIQAATVEFLR